MSLYRKWVVGDSLAVLLAVTPSSTRREQAWFRSPLSAPDPPRIPCTVLERTNYNLCCTDRLAMSVPRLWLSRFDPHLRRKRVEKPFSPDAPRPLYGTTPTECLALGFDDEGSCGFVVPTLPCLVPCNGDVHEKRNYEADIENGWREE